MAHAEHGQAAPVGHHDGEHAHPGTGQYVKIALILGVITAVEVLIYYFDLNKATLIASLLIMSAGKFALVAAFFMHLKFDSRLFTTLFAGGLVMAIAAFIAVLAMFRAF
ncbi:MAG TPA: cytochrome C oxidase subunit IV family protein [Chloroflexota bacterium]|nr:cytochrome C oxidase subunit IV family protein [Chloroflexota bacterium]